MSPQQQSFEDALAGLGPKSIAPQKSFEDALAAAGDKPQTVFPTRIETTAGTRIMPPVGEQGAEPNTISKIIQFGAGMARPKSVGDVLSLLVPSGGGAVAKSAVGKTGQAISATGEALERVGSSQATKHLSGSAALFEMLSAGDWRKAIAAYAIPPLTRATGRAMKAGGAGLEAASKFEGLKFGKAPVAADASTAAATLADDVALIRESISMKWNPEIALRIVADGNKDYYDLLKSALASSLKTEGMPPPKAVSDLMKLPAFQRLPKP